MNCNYQFVECSNEGCNEEIERRHLDNHICNKCPKRMYNCPFCGEEDTYTEITTTHYTVCDDMPLPCLGGCIKRGLLRSTMEDHLTKECPEELVACTFAIAGCQQIIRRKDLQLHLQNKDQHLNTILSSYVSLSLLVRDLLYDNTPNVPLPFRPWLQNTPTRYPRPPWVFRMDGFQKKKEKNTRWFSDPVYSHFGGYKMCLCVCANGVDEEKDTHLSVLVCMMRGDHDSKLKWPFEGTVEVSLLNQLEDKNHHSSAVWSPFDDIPESDCGRITNGVRSAGWGESDFIPHEELGYDDEDNTQFLKDDTLFFMVNSIEPDLSLNGSLLRAIRSIASF